MTIDTYAEQARKTAMYPANPCLLDACSLPVPLYTALGLCGETGEIAQKLKKIIRDKDGEVTSADALAIGDEIGDVLWYCANLAQDLGLSLENIALRNVEKLRSRAARGTLGGSGDNR